MLAKGQADAHTQLHGLAAQHLSLCVDSVDSGGHSSGHRWTECRQNGRQARTHSSMVLHHDIAAYVYKMRAI